MPTHQANGTTIDNAALDTIGLAFGFALAVYDQTTSNGGRFDRINQTSRELFQLIEDERFSEAQAAVLEAVAAGLSSVVRVGLLHETGSLSKNTKFI